MTPDNTERKPTLQPLSLGDLLDQVIRFYKTHFLKLIGVAAIPNLCALPIAIGAAAFSIWAQELPTSGTPSLSINQLTMMGGGLLLALGYLIVYFLVAILGFGAGLTVVSESYLGNAVTISQAYRYTFKRSPGLIWTCFLTALLSALVIGICGVGGMLLMGLMALLLSSMGAMGAIIAGLLGLLGFFMCLIPAVIFMLRWIFSPHAFMIDSRSGRDALRRSKYMAKGEYGRIILMFLFIMVTSFIVVIISVYGPFWIYMAIRIGLSGGNALSALANPDKVSMFVSHFLSLVGGTLSAPLWPIATTLLYFDIRVRKEGFDLDVLARNLGYEDTPA